MTVYLGDHGVLFNGILLLWQQEMLLQKRLEELMCDDPNHNHEMDWAKQNQLMKEWKEANPDAEYEGWMSI